MRKMVLVSAIWCSSCIIMRPRYQEIIKGKFDEVVELDFDDDDEEVDMLGINNKLPVAIIYENDKEVMRIIGEKTLKELQEIIG